MPARGTHRTCHRGGARRFMNGWELHLVSVATDHVLEKSISSSGSRSIRRSCRSADRSGIGNRWEQYDAMVITLQPTIGLHPYLPGLIANPREAVFHPGGRGSFRDPQRRSIYGRGDRGTGHLGVAVRIRRPSQDRQNADASRRLGGSARQIEDRCGPSCDKVGHDTGGNCCAS